MFDNTFDQRLQSLDVVINAAFLEGLAKATNTQTNVAMQTTSTGAASVYPLLDQIPDMRKFVGPREIIRLNAHGFRIENDEFERTIAIKKTQIDDNQLSFVGPAVSGLGLSAGNLPDKLVWDVVKSGFDTEGYDGQFFYDTDHPIELADGTTSTWSNYAGGTPSNPAWFLMDTSQILMPFVRQEREAPAITPHTDLTDPNVFKYREFIWDAYARYGAGFGMWQLVYASHEALTETTLEAAMTQLRETPGHRGTELNLAPSLLVVPPALEWTAKRLINSAELNGSSNVLQNAVDLHVENRLK